MGSTVETIRTINLGHEQMLVFESQHGSRVRVLYGATWLTEEGEAGDSIVRSGEEVSLRGSGTAIVQGLGPARVELLDQHRARPAQRLADGWRRTLSALRRWVKALQLGAPAAAKANV